MTIYLLVLIFIMGIVVGSFLNVCIYRIPRGESIVWPSSHCTSCDEKLKPSDLVPIFSFIFLKGRCRYCKAKISFRYPMIEFLTGAVFISLFLRFGLTVELGAALYFMSILIAVFFIDLNEKIIPNGLVIAGLAGGLLLVVTKIIFHGSTFGNVLWWEHLLGIIPGTIFLFVVALLGMFIYKTDDAMGMGDVKIFAPIGLLLGWKLCIVALFSAVFLGGLISFLLIVTRIKDRKDVIPFGPFIVIGTFITLLFGDIIIKWYLNFL